LVVLERPPLEVAQGECENAEVTGAAVVRTQLAMMVAAVTVVKETMVGNSDRGC
jgi:hypothetical protein